MANTINITVDKTSMGLDQVNNTSDLNKPISTATQTALNGKVDSNSAITGATKTKITYDSKGLVTAGADATTADITEVTDKRYVTDAQLTLIGNTSGVNTGNETNATIKTKLGAATSTNDGYLTASDWSTFNGKQDALGFTPEDVSNKSNDINLGNSTSLYPTQNAVKVYTDNLLGNANALVYKGTIDCSTNPNYPSANAGELYIVSVAGKIGGASGVNVEAGDMLICNTDSTASGNQATVGAYWNAIQKNIDGAVTGPSSSANNKVVVFDGTTGKLLKEGSIFDNGTNVGVGFSLPTAKLAIKSSSQTKFGGVLLEATGSTNTPAVMYEASSESGVLELYSGATLTTRVFANGFSYFNGGNVGIGITTPTSKLHVVGDVNIATINNATTNTDKFLVSDLGVVKHRTALQLKSDLSLDQVNNTSDVNKPISSATQTALDNKSDKNITLDRKTASYTLVSGDNNKLIEMNVATANTLTINASIFSAGNQILISQYGAGQTTITAGAGVTLRSSGGKLKTSAQYALCTIIAISSTEFYVSGDLTA